MPCSKSQLGKIKILSNVKYICKNNIWTVQNKKPTITVPPIQQAKPTIEAVSPPVAYEETKTLSIDEKAFNIIKAHQVDTITNISYNTYVLNNFSKEIYDAYDKSILDTISYWDDFIDFKANIDIYFITEKDINEFSNTFRNRYKNSDQTVNRISNFLLNSNRGSSLGGSGGIQIRQDGQEVGVAIIWANSYNNIRDYYFQPELVAHEITHLYQFLAIKGTFGIFDYSENNKAAVPCNFIEGSANLFGIALSSKTYKEYITQKNIVRNRYLRQEGIPTESDALDKIKSSGYWNSDKCSIGYIVGLYVYELFINTYGLDSYINIFYLLGSSKNFDLAILKTTGLHAEELYSNSKAYVYLSYSQK